MEVESDAVLSQWMLFGNLLFAFPVKFVGISLRDAGGSLNNLFSTARLAVGPFN